MPEQHERAAERIWRALPAGTRDALERGLPRTDLQSLLIDVSRSEDNTILFVTHDVSEAVYLADTIYVLSSRPARILHKVDVPYFAVRDVALTSLWSSTTLDLLKL